MKLNKFLLFIFLLFGSLQGTSKISKELLQAAEKNNEKEVRKLIANGANVNTQNKNGQTSLHLTQDPMVIHELIICHANLNKTDRNGKTPFYQALLDSNKKKAMILLYSGAKVNIMSQGSTPLSWAIEHNDYDLVLQLVKAGAKVTAQRIKEAHTKGYDTIAQLLGHYQKFKGKKHLLVLCDSKGQTKMHQAIIQNDPIMVDALNLAGVGINIKNSKGQTPMHVAVDSNSPEMTQRLLNLQAKVNMQDNNGETPFHYATKKGSFAISSILHKQGATVYLPDKQGKTPLSYIKQNDKLASLIPDRKTHQQVAC